MLPTGEIRGALVGNVQNREQSSAASPMSRTKHPLTQNDSEGTLIDWLKKTEIMKLTGGLVIFPSNIR